MRAAAPLALAGGAITVAGATSALWWMTAGGVALLAIAGALRPAFWLAALLAALPFAYGLKLPLAPGRNVDLIDLGVFGGILIMVAA